LCALSIWEKYTGSDLVIAVVASIRMGRHIFLELLMCITCWCLWFMGIIFSVFGVYSLGSKAISDITLRY